MRFLFILMVLFTQVSVGHAAWSSFDPNKPADTRRWDKSDDDIRTNWTALWEFLKSPTDSYFVVGDGTNWTTETGATLRTSIGVAIGSDVQAYEPNLSDPNLMAFTDLAGTATHVPYFDGPGDMNSTASTAFGRSLWADANAVEHKATVNLDHVYDVRDYGATVDDGSDNDSTGINAAIQLASNDGGGVVLMPPGNYAGSDPILFADSDSTMYHVTLKGYGARFTSTSTTHIVTVGDATYAMETCGIHGIYFSSSTVWCGMFVTGTGVRENTFVDLKFEGATSPDPNSMGICLWATGAGNYFNTFERIKIFDFGVNTSWGYNFNTSAAASDSSNANMFLEITNYDQGKYGFYNNNTTGGTYIGDFDHGSGSLYDIYFTNTANSNMLRVRAESGADDGVQIDSGCINNFGSIQILSNTFNDDNAAISNNWEVTYSGHARFFTEYAYAQYLESGVSQRLLITKPDVNDLALLGETDGQGTYVRDLQTITESLTDTGSYWTSGYLGSVTDHDDLDFGTDQDFSVEVVFKPYDTTSTTNKYLVSKEAGGVGYGLYVDEDDLVLRYDDGSTDRTGVIGTAAVTKNTWYHCIVTFDRDGNATLYVNGESWATGSNPRDISTATATLSNAGDFTVGAITGGSSSFIGEIARVRVFNRLLSAADVVSAYGNEAVEFRYLGANNDAGLTGNDASCDGASNWVQGSGTTLTEGAADPAAGGRTVHKALSAGTNTAAAYITYANWSTSPAVGKRLQIQLDMYVPSANTTAKGLKPGNILDDQSTGGGLLTSALDTWETVKLEANLATASNSLWLQYLDADGVTPINGTNGDIIYFDNIQITQVGAVLDLDYANAEYSYWRDQSGNGHDLTINAATPVQAIQNGDKGTDTIASGTTSQAVTHNLGYTPTIFGIAFLEQSTNDPGAWWVSGASTTQFTLNVTNDPGASNLDFSWTAE